MWTLLKILGWLAIPVGSFFLTLYGIDAYYPPTTDEIRAKDIKTVKSALESYRAKNGKYPSPILDTSLTELNKTLVSGGFLSAIPLDPYYGEKADGGYRYISVGPTYGLLVHTKGGTCLTGVETEKTGWWGQPPQCSF